MKGAIVVIAALCVGSGAWAAEENKAPIAANPIVELRGKVAKVQVSPGEGMPFLELESNGKTSKVYLGSMRYLMQNNFNPKAGSAATVKGYQTSDSVMAIEVDVEGGGALKLRDASGWPLWMGQQGQNKGGQGKGKGWGGGKGYGGRR